MKLMILRELKEGWRSFRFPGIALMALFFALLEPPSQKYMDLLLNMFAEGIEISLPAPTPEAAFIAYTGDILFIVLIALIIVTMGIAARERHNGLTEWFLTRPVSRNAYILAKAVYVFTTTFVIIAFSAVTCAIYTYTLLGALNPLGVFYAIVLLTTYVMIPLTLTLVVSALTGIAGAAAAAGIGVMFLMSTVGMIVRAEWLPINLTRQLPQILLGNASSSFWVAIALSWSFIALLVWLMKQRFCQEQI